MVRVVEDGTAFETAYLAAWRAIFGQHVVDKTGMQTATDRWNSEYGMRLDRLIRHRSPLTKNAEAQTSKSYSFSNQLASHKIWWRENLLPKIFFPEPDGWNRYTPDDPLYRSFFYLPVMTEPTRGLPRPPPAQ